MTSGKWDQCEVRVPFVCKAPREQARNGSNVVCVSREGGKMKAETKEHCCE